MGFCGTLAAAVVVALVAIPFFAIQIADYVLWDGHLGEYQKVGWDYWYSFMYHLDPNKNFEFMNWGLSTDPLHKCTEGSSEPLQANLYTQLGSMAGSWEGARVLEVGRGRGGGAKALSKCFCPSIYVGMDLNSLQVESAQKRSGSSGPCPLTFVQGDAENLPFPDASFDIVVNVESSHTYPHFDRFVAEVRRVLRPGGRFVITDFRERPQLPAMLATLGSSPLHEIGSEDITKKVAASLREELSVSGRVRKVVNLACPSYFEAYCLKFAGESAQKQMEADSKAYVMKAYELRGVEKLVFDGDVLAYAANRSSSR
jgi:ubiquinone/menaquinone biosynthesis C-methylase UbiE